MKKVTNIIVLMALVTLFICNSVYATVTPVTDENLKRSLEKFSLSESNEENYNITVSKNAIITSIDNETYTINYDLSNKPTFTFEIPIEKGMSYDEFKKHTENLVLPMIGYVAVANIQGVEFEDATSYFLFSYLGSALKGSFPFDSSNSYMIIEDTTDGVTIGSDNTNVIKASEFGERVIEYVNAVYPETQSVSDSEDINSYTLTVERKDTTDTSCKLVSTLSVNLDADFSKIIGYTEQMADSFLNRDITKENADLVVTLKVGQKCKIESTEKITGYEFSGYDCIEINEDKTEITATSVGIKNGYIYIGEEKKSIYITVEGNADSSFLETISLKIDNVSDKGTEEENIQKDSQTQIENELDIDTLPRTGEETNVFLIVLYIIVGICSIGLITLVLMKRK